MNAFVVKLKVILLRNEGFKEVSHVAEVFKCLCCNCNDNFMIIDRQQYLGSTWGEFLWYHKICTIYFNQTC